MGVLKSLRGDSKSHEVDNPEKPSRMLREILNYPWVKGQGDKTQDPVPINVEKDPKQTPGKIFKSSYSQQFLQTQLRS